jgi:CRP-like cAMP-binding protein
MMKRILKGPKVEERVNRMPHQGSAASPWTANLLLASLQNEDHRTLLPHLSQIELKQHMVLFDVRDIVDSVYFPIDAIISLVVPLSTGEAVETAMVGRDGLIGAGPALNGRMSLNRAVVQIGGRCLRLSAEPLKDVIKNHPSIHALISAHEQVLFAQAQQSAACNVMHDLPSRLARWLLRAFDLRGGKELNLTQEYLAQLLGVRRTSVSVVAHTLQQAGMISYARGHIRLLNIAALKETACECYETVRINYDALLNPPNK